MTGYLRLRRGGLVRPLLTLLGLLLLAGYVLVSDESRALAKEHDGEVGTRDCTTLPTLICVGNVGISGLGTRLTAGSSDSFNVNATNLVSTTTSPYTLKVSVPSSSPIGFNSNCSSKSQSWSIQGPSSSTKSATLYGCRWSSNASITVTASLSHGGYPIESATHGVTVVPTKPNPVGGLSVDEGNAKLTLTWSKPTWDGGANLTGYQVQNNEGTPGWPGGSSVINNPNTLNYTVQPLVNGTPYRVRVRACNAASLCSDWREGGGTPPGPATPTPTPTVTAVPASKPAQVTGVSVMRSSGGGSLEVTWEIPTVHGSADLSGFHVQHDGGTPGWLGTFDVVTPGSATMHTIANAFSDRIYMVRVQACNKAALCGTWSEGVTEDVPDPPPPPMVTAPGLIEDLTVEAGDARLTAGWTAPSTGGAPRDYKVQIKLSSGSWPSDDRAYTVTGRNLMITMLRDGTALTNGTAYKVRVRACNTGGCSAWSGSASGTPDVAALARPTGLSVVPLIRTSSILGVRVRLSWDGNTEDPPDNYVVERSTDGATWTVTDTLPSATTSTELVLDPYLSVVDVVRFSVKATKVQDGESITSAPAIVYIVDNPIVSIDGNSKEAGTNGPGVAKVKWPTVEGATSYTIRYRGLRGDHSSLSLDWRPKRWHCVGERSTRSY